MAGTGDHPFLLRPEHDTPQMGAGGRQGVVTVLSVDDKDRFVVHRIDRPLAHGQVGGGSNGHPAAACPGSLFGGPQIGDDGRGYAGGGRRRRKTKQEILEKASTVEGLTGPLVLCSIDRLSPSFPSVQWCLASPRPRPGLANLSCSRLYHIVRLRRNYCRFSHKSKTGSGLAFAHSPSAVRIVVLSYRNRPSPTLWPGVLGHVPTQVLDAVDEDLDGVLGVVDAAPGFLRMKLKL